MVNSGSFDTEADRNEKGDFTHSNRVAESPQSASSVQTVTGSLCENDFSTETADSLPISQAIEPTATKTEYKCNISSSTSEHPIGIVDEKFKSKTDENYKQCSSIEKFNKPDDSAIRNELNVNNENKKMDVLRSSSVKDAKNQNQIGVYCSVPLEKVQKILNLCGSNGQRLIIGPDQREKQVPKKDMCLYCDRTFVTPSLKQKHVDRFHSLKHNRRLSARRQATKQSITACMFCEKLNNTECSLRGLFEHLVLEHSKKYFGCLDCEIRFPNITVLENHLIKMHRNINECVLVKNEPPLLFKQTYDLSENTTANEKSFGKTQVTKITEPCTTQEEEFKDDLAFTENTFSATTTNRNASSSKDANKNKLNLSRDGEDKQSPNPITTLPLNSVGPINTHSGDKSTTRHNDDGKSCNNKEKLKTNCSKELRSKKVIGTKTGIKQCVRVTRQQSKIIENVKAKKKKSKIEKGERNDETTTRNFQSAINSAFDFTFRVKKITDHSIDNIKISSLTFDDVFDKAFFSRVKCNIQENLLNYIDGKLFKSEESENRISSFQKSSKEIQIEETQVVGQKITSSTTVSPVSDILTPSQKNDDSESQSEAKPLNKKKTAVVNDVVHYKYFTRRKYQAVISESKENPDLSKLDMWTQLAVKNRQQKILSDKRTDKETLEYTASDEYKTKMQVEELDKILDKRGPEEDLKEEAIRKVALEKWNGTSNESKNMDSYFDVTVILNDLLNGLFSSETAVSTTKEEKNISYYDLTKEDHSNFKPYPSKGDEIPSMLNLSRISNSSEKTDSELESVVELTGEWARSKMYVCAACGVKVPNMKTLIDHKNLFHEHVWCQHYEFVGNQGELYRHLSIPSLGKVGAVEENCASKMWRRSDARVCSKCDKQFNCLGDLHRHVLECGGDWSWMLARKKYKYRPYGKPRKKRRGLLKFLHTFRERKNCQSREKRKTIKKFDGPRQKPSDADTIQRMLANLPAKRITRKVICLKDGFQRTFKNKRNIKTNNTSQQLTKSKKHLNKTTNEKHNGIKNCSRLLRSNSRGFENHLTKLKDNSNANSTIRRHSVRKLNQILSNKIVKTNSVIVKRKTVNDKNVCNKNSNSKVTTAEQSTSSNSVNQTRSSRKKTISEKSGETDLKEQNSKEIENYVKNIKTSFQVKNMPQGRKLSEETMPEIPKPKIKSSPEAKEKSLNKEWKNQNRKSIDEMETKKKTNQNIENTVDDNQKLVKITKNKNTTKNALNKIIKRVSSRISENVAKEISTKARTLRKSGASKVLNVAKTAANALKKVTKKKLKVNAKNRITKIVQVDGSSQNNSTRADFDNVELQTDSNPSSNYVTSASGSSELSSYVSSFNILQDEPSKSQTSFEVYNYNKPELTPVTFFPQAFLELPSFVNKNESQVQNSSSNIDVNNINNNESGLNLQLNCDDEKHQENTDSCKYDEKKETTVQANPVSTSAAKKKLKKQRGLNDCIAMLTNKLQSKICQQNEEKDEEEPNTFRETNDKNESKVMFNSEVHNCRFSINNKCYPSFTVCSETSIENGSLTSMNGKSKAVENSPVKREVILEIPKPLNLKRNKSLIADEEPCMDLSIPKQLQTDAIKQPEMDSCNASKQHEIICLSNAKAETNLVDPTVDSIQKSDINSSQKQSIASKGLVRNGSSINRFEMDSKQLNVDSTVPKQSDMGLNSSGQSNITPPKQPEVTLGSPKQSNIDLTLPRQLDLVPILVKQPDIEFPKLQDELVHPIIQVNENSSCTPTEFNTLSSKSNEEHLSSPATEIEPAKNNLTTNALKTVDNIKYDTPINCLKTDVQTIFKPKRARKSRNNTEANKSRRKPKSKPIVEPITFEENEHPLENSSALEKIITEGISNMSENSTKLNVSEDCSNSGKENVVVKKKSKQIKRKRYMNETEKCDYKKTNDNPISIPKQTKILSEVLLDCTEKLETTELTDSEDDIPLSLFASKNKNEINLEESSSELNTANCVQSADEDLPEIANVPENCANNHMPKSIDKKSGRTPASKIKTDTTDCLEIEDSHTNADVGKKSRKTRTTTRKAKTDDVNLSNDFRASDEITPLPETQSTNKKRSKSRVRRSKNKSQINSKLENIQASFDDINANIGSSEDTSNIIPESEVLKILNGVSESFRDSYVNLTNDSQSFSEFNIACRSPNMTPKNFGDAVHNLGDASENCSDAVENRGDNIKSFSDVPANFKASENFSNTFEHFNKTQKDSTEALGDGPESFSVTSKDFDDFSENGCEDLNTTTPQIFNTTENYNNTPKLFNDLENLSNFSKTPKNFPGAFNPIDLPKILNKLSDTSETDGIINETSPALSSNQLLPEIDNQTPNRPENPDEPSAKLLIKVSTLNDSQSSKPKSNRKTKLSKSKKPPKSKPPTNLNEAYCDICNKTFSRNENLLKHKRTLTHIAKLSELEALEANKKLLEEEPKENKICNEIEETITTRDEFNVEDNKSCSIQDMDDLYTSSNSFNLTSSKDGLKLVDIINDVLSKPVSDDEYSHNNFSNFVLSSNSEIKRCKSLGERKSFDSDQLVVPNRSPTPRSPDMSLSTSFNVSKNPSTANIIVEKQISLLENIIEDNLKTATDKIFTSPNLPSLSEDYSSQSNSSSFSLLSTSKQEDCSEITFTHNTNIITNLIKPSLDEDNLIQSSHYEEISEDSISSQFQFEEHKSRKVLNRDEELFLECCSLLKSSSDMSELSKKTKRMNFHDDIGSRKPKTLSKQTGYLSENSMAGYNFSNNTYSNMDSADKFSFLNKKVNVFTQPPMFEDISTESENSSNKSSNNDVSFNYQCPFEQNETSDSTKAENRVSPNVESAQVPEEFGKVVSLENSIKRNDIKESKSDNFRRTFEVSEEMKKEKKDSTKQPLTKGAMKTFEGLKVSIPKEGLNMNEVLSCSPTSKRLEIEAKEKISLLKPLQKTPVIKKPPSKKSSSLKKELLNLCGNKLGFKVKKKKPISKSKNSFKHGLNKLIDTEKKSHDIYDFEETQDNIDVFGKDFSSLQTYHSFKNKLNETFEHKPNSEIEETINEGNSEFLPPPSPVKPSPKKVNPPSSVTKKKCMIMGRIFKNALKSKLEDEIKTLPVVDNTKIIADYVMDCSKQISCEQKVSNDNHKLTEEEMNMIFDSLLNEGKTNSTTNVDESKKHESNLTDSAMCKKNFERKSKLQKANKGKKRHRTNSSSTSDEEFSIKKNNKKNCSRKATSTNKVNECVINLEQELKECIGVASRKSQRKCTSGKQNVLVEYWSSDESNFDIQELEQTETLVDVNKKIVENKIFCTSQSLEDNSNVINDDESQTNLDVYDEPEVKECVKDKAPLKTSTNSTIKKKSNAKKEIDVVSSSTSEVADVNSPQTIASGRQKRTAVDTLYYWSSSSDDEMQEVIEVKPIREDYNDDEDRPLQHGWIVGDSPKKLVTMLAQAKGKKVDVECVKKSKKKRTSST